LTRNGHAQSAAASHAQMPVPVSPAAIRIPEAIPALA